MLQGPDDQEGSQETVLQLPPGCDRQRLPEVQVLLQAQQLRAHRSSVV